jgi:hypothetical protein
MKDTYLFIVAGTAIALFAIYKGTISDVDNILSMVISAMAGCITGYHAGIRDKKD